MLPAIAGSRGSGGAQQRSYSTPLVNSTNNSHHRINQTTSHLQSVGSRLLQKQREDQGRHQRLSTLRNLGAAANTSLTEESLGLVEQLLGSDGKENGSNQASAEVLTGVESSIIGTGSAHLASRHLSSDELSYVNERVKGKRGTLSAHRRQKKYGRKNSVADKEHSASFNIPSNVDACELEEASKLVKTKGAAVDALTHSQAQEGQTTSKKKSTRTLASLKELRSALFPPAETHTATSDADGQDSARTTYDYPTNALVAYDESGLLPPSELLNRKAKERRKALGEALKTFRLQHPEVGGLLEDVTTIFDEFLGSVCSELANTPTTVYFNALGQAAADVDELSREKNTHSRRIQELEAEVLLLRKENDVLREASTDLNGKTKHLSEVLKTTTNQVKAFVEAQHIASDIQAVMEGEKVVPSSGEEDHNGDHESLPTLDEWLRATTPNAMAGMRFAHEWRERQLQDEEIILDLQAKVRELEEKLERTKIDLLAAKRDSSRK